MSERKHTPIKQILMGEYKFTEKIEEQQPDIDTPINDCLETLPPLTIEGGVFSIEYADGRVIENPTFEEVDEWAKTCGIPYYDESEGKEDA